MAEPWVAVDLDGTLAYYDRWRGIEHVGEPIPAMLRRVKKWLDNGYTVKIFTARVCVGEPELGEVIAHIHAWCRRHGLPELPVTNVKDFGMVEHWDDRCVQVIPNTGRRADGACG